MVVTGVEANIDGRVQKIRSRIVVDALRFECYTGQKSWLT